MNTYGTWREPIVPKWYGSPRKSLGGLWINALRYTDRMGITWYVQRRGGEGFPIWVMAGEVCLSFRTWHSARLYLDFGISEADDE